MNAFPDVSKLTITQIAQRLATCEEVDEAFLACLEQDDRQGVHKLISAYYRRKDRRRELRGQWEEMCLHELPIWSKGGSLVGVDEAGRGPLAGPVVAACVILPQDAFIPGLADSKTLSARQRGELFKQILEVALDYGVGIVGPEEIDELNIFQATQVAMAQAIKGVKVPYELVLVDGNQPCRILSVPQKPVIRGDALSVSIAAASIIAKETRDSLMIEADALYPGYGFAQHKGYGTTEHLKALVQLGPSPIHRRSFAPVAALCREEQGHGGSGFTGTCR